MEIFGVIIHILLHIFELLLIIGLANRLATDETQNADEHKKLRNETHDIWHDIHIKEANKID